MTQEKCTITPIDSTESLHPLYMHYPGQTSAQGAYIELDLRNGSISASYNPEIGNAVPMPVWHGHIRRYTVSRYLTRDEINDLMEEIAPLAEKLMSVYRSEWDGSNHVARFDESLDMPGQWHEVEGEIAELCASAETSSFGVVDGDHWFCDLVIDEEKDQARLNDGSGHIVTSKTTDEELAQIEKEIDEEATGDGCTVDGLYEYLENLRDQLREAQEV